MLEARKVVTAVSAVVAATALALASSASSLTLPTVTVTPPTVTVKTPAITVTTPPLPVKTPTVPVKTPTLPVKTPTVPVKAPTVPVKAPAVPVKTPTISAKTPGQVPTGGQNLAKTSVKRPIRCVRGSTRFAEARSRRRQQSSTGNSVAGQRSTSTGGGGSAASRGGSTAPAPLGEYRSIGGGYRQLPVSEGRRGRRARARIARRERMLKAKVARFRGCLSDLPGTQRELLELRTGLGTPRALSPRAVASRLHVGPARFARLERQAVRELSDAASTHACGRMSEVVARVASFIGAGFGGAQPTATGGVKAVSYSAAPPAKGVGTRSSTMLGRLLGADIPAVASDLILVLLLTMGAGAIVLAVMADAVGQGPRHEQWRQRVIGRVRWFR